MNKKSAEYTMTEEQAAAMESRLSTDTDALVSSILTNEKPESFLLQLHAFIAKKNSDISSMCSEHSKTFSKSIKGAQTLGQNATDLREQVNTLQSQISTDIKEYEETLERTTRLRSDISLIDTKLAALSECQIIMQKLQNINDEIKAGNYYVAIVRVLEFADYDSKITSCSAIQGLQKDGEPVISYVEQLAEKKMKEWLTSFSKKCQAIGSAFLYGTEQTPLDLNDIYEYYLIERQLGRLDKFRDFYIDRRRRQLNNLIESHHSTKDLEEHSKELFSIVAGFFVTESRISGDGFNLIPQTKIDECWSTTLMLLQSSFVTTTRASTIDDLITLSHNIIWFSEKMSTCSLSCNVLHDFISKKSTQFKMFLFSSGNSKIKEIIENNSQETMTVRTPEDFKLILQFGLEEPQTEFPAEMSFVPAIPMLCAHVNELVTKWTEFSGTSNDKLLIEIYESLMTSCSNQLATLGTSLTAIPTCGYMISSLTTLIKSLPYFEKTIQTMCQSSSKPNNEVLRKKILSSIDTISTHLKSLFDDFMLQLLDVHCIKAMENGQPPHNFAQELVTFLGTMAEILKPVLSPDLFKTTVENIAITLSTQIAHIFATTKKVKWTPELISNASVNVMFIGNLSTLIAVPSAKQKMNGVTKMLSLLLNNQLMAITSEPAFKDKNKDIPFDAMVNILQQYSPKTKKALYVIPSNLVKSLITKFIPFCNEPEKFSSKKK